MAVLAVVAGCNKPESLRKTVLVPVTVEASSNETKAAFDRHDGQTYISFSELDRIGIYDGESVKPFETAEGGSRADFTGEVAMDAETGEALVPNYYAVYPYSEGMEYNGGAISVNIPNIQVPVLDGFDPAAQIGYAKADASRLSFNFTNAVAFAKVKVSVDNVNLLGILATNEDGSTLSGSLKINPETGEMTDGDAAIWSYVQFSTLLEQGVYYLCLKPGTYDIQFFAETADGERYCNYSMSDVTFEANCAKYIINLTEDKLSEKTEPGTAVSDEGSLGLGTYLLVADNGSGVIKIAENPKYPSESKYRYTISQIGNAGSFSYNTWDVVLWTSDETSKFYVLLYKKDATAPYAYMALHDATLHSDSKSSGLTRDYLAGLHGSVINGEKITTKFSVYKVEE